MENSRITTLETLLGSNSLNGNGSASVNKRYKVAKFSAVYAPLDSSSTSVVQVPVFSPRDSATLPSIFVGSLIMKGFPSIPIRKWDLVIYDERFVIFTREDISMRANMSIRPLSDDLNWHGDLLIFQFGHNHMLTSVINDTQHIQAQTVLLCFMRGIHQQLVADTSPEPIPVFNPTPFLRQEIHSLPFENLSNIFSECRKIEKETSPISTGQFIVPSENDLAFTLSKVCIHWETVARQTPALCNAISVPPLDQGSSSDPDQYDLMTKWLDFSNGALSIRLRLPTPPFRRYVMMNGSTCTDCSEQHATRMFTILLKAKERWQTLDITFNSSLLEDFVMAIQTHKTSESPFFAANLRQLRITFQGRFSDNDGILIDSVIAWTNTLPALHSLRLDDSRTLIKDLKSLPSRVPKLTIVRSDMSVVHSARILFLCQFTSVIELHGRFTGDDKASPLLSPTPGPRRFENSSLTSLGLYGIQGSINLLAQFDFPALRSLHIAGYLEHDILHQSDSPTASAILSEFILRSRCKLQRLIVLDTNMPIDEAFLILNDQSMKKIPDLQLNFSMCMSPFMELLIIGEQYQWFRRAGFMVWKHRDFPRLRVRDWQSTADNHIVGWKNLDDDEIMVWEVGPEGVVVRRLE